MNASRLVLRISGLVLALVSGLPMVPIFVLAVLQRPRRYHYYYFAPSAEQPLGIPWMTLASPTVFAVACAMLVHSFAKAGKTSLEQWLLRIAGTVILIWSGLKLVMRTRPVVMNGNSDFAAIISEGNYPSTFSMATFFLIGLVLIGLSYIGRRDEHRAAASESTREDTP